MRSRREQKKGRNSIFEAALGTTCLKTPVFEELSSFLMFVLETFGLIVTPCLVYVLAIGNDCCPGFMIDSKSFYFKTCHDFDNSYMVTLILP